MVSGTVLLHSLLSAYHTLLCTIPTYLSSAYASRLDTSDVFCLIINYEFHCTKVSHARVVGHTGN